MKFSKDIGANQEPHFKTLRTLILDAMNTREKDKCEGINGESMTLKYRVVLEPGENGWIVATVPAVKGCVSQGKTREEALAKVKEALEGILETRRERGWPIPDETVV